MSNLLSGNHGRWEADLHVPAGMRSTTSRRRRPGVAAAHGWVPGLIPAGECVAEAMEPWRRSKTRVDVSTDHCLAKRR